LVIKKTNRILKTSKKISIFRKTNVVVQKTSVFRKINASIFLNTNVDEKKTTPVCKKPMLTLRLLTSVVSTSVNNRC